MDGWKEEGKGWKRKKEGGNEVSEVHYMFP